MAAAVDGGLAGIECLSGIPGSTGATPIQNVGAYGQDVAQTVTSVRVYDRERDTVEDLPAEALGFGYRTSALRYQDRRVVLRVRFELTASDVSGALRYAELARAVGADRAPLHDVRAAVLDASPWQGHGHRSRGPGLGVRGLVLHQPDPRRRGVRSACRTRARRSRHGSPSPTAA